MAEFESYIYPTTFFVFTLYISAFANSNFFFKGHPCIYLIALKAKSQALYEEEVNMNMSKMSGDKDGQV
jgi:hypothetical protein